MNYYEIASKFFKAIIFGAIASIVSIDLSTFSFDNVSAVKKFGAIMLTAAITGALHSIWEFGKQYTSK